MACGDDGGVQFSHRRAWFVRLCGLVVQALVELPIASPVEATFSGPRVVLRFWLDCQAQVDRTPVEPRALQQIVLSATQQEQGQEQEQERQQAGNHA